jgi:hypothetical protein
MSHSSFFEQGKQGRISDKMLLLRKVSVKVLKFEAERQSLCFSLFFPKRKIPVKKRRMMCQENAMKG